MAYRLGVDIGTNSLGWCVLGLDGEAAPAAVDDIGVRLFPDGRDPRSGASLAVDRRTARSMRRRRDRYLRRRSELMRELVRRGLMPEEAKERKALEGLDPYALRARGLDEALTPHELGRAIFHLNQRRGFKSNRRTDRADEKEAGKIKSAISKLEAAMAASGARTVGEHLHRRHRKGKSVRARLRGQGAKAEYDFYVQREMLEAEFDRLWQAQRAHHPDLLGDEAREALRGILFRQRPLRPVSPGKCALDPATGPDDAGGFRAPEALPLAQRARIFQELNNLRIVSPDFSERSLTLDERDALAAELLGKAKLTFKRMRRVLKLGTLEAFNLESEKRDHLKGDQTAAALAKKGRFGPRWHEIPADRQSGIVERLLAEEDEAVLVDWLRDTWELEAEAAQAVAAARLPDGYVRLGRRALAKVVPALVRDVVTFDKAVVEAGYKSHSDRRTGEIFDALPYYGEALDHHVSGSGDPEHGPEARYGRIANPTVHIGLNQLRKLVNELIAEYGHPAEIVVELTRELKLGQKEKARRQREQAENQRRNDQRREKLAEQGLDDNGENRLRLRLWEELNPDDPANRRCVYSGEQISIARLFSPEIEIDHILPFSRTLDNSAANRTVSSREANRVKRNKTPYEAFGGDEDAWNAILARAEELPANKRWRFAEDAMERFEANRNFLDRQLTDTAYLSRIAREYLTGVCDPNRVRAIPGQLTAMLRGKWGLNSLLSDHNLKNRSDHRHHAIDAAVAAVTDQGLLQRIASAAEESRERLIDDMPEPWPGFRDDLRGRLEGLQVSYKPDHGKQGRLHEETAYGLIADPDKEEGYNLVYRKPLDGLTENEVERIRDKALRARLRDYIHEAKNAGLTLKQALANFAEKAKVRRVRLLKREADVIPIAGKDGVPYKAYVPGDNHHIDIYAPPGGGPWRGEAATVFEVNQPGYAPRWPREHPGARLVMRVHKGDLMRLLHEGREQVMRVVRLEVAAGRLRLAGHREGGELEKRHADPDDPFRWTFAAFGQLERRRARKVSVDVLGRVSDPGPPA